MMKKEARVASRPPPQGGCGQLGRVPARKQAGCHGNCSWSCQRSYSRLKTCILWGTGNKPSLGKRQAAQLCSGRRPGLCGLSPEEVKESQFLSCSSPDLLCRSSLPAVLCGVNRVCQQPQREDGPGLQYGPEGSIQEMGPNTKTSSLQRLSKGHPADALNTSCLPHKYEVHTGNST